SPGRTTARAARIAAESVADLFAPACSITKTRRRRFLWAAWWTGPPSREPFRKPDASNGGARTREEALGEAERAAGRPLVETEGLWARAWARILVGEAPWTERLKPEERSPGRLPERAPTSAWAVLGIDRGASLADIKRAFRKRALETHPDRGGDAEAFKEAKR